MSDFLPSHFGVPFVTTLPDAKFDGKGRMMAFVESDVQRLERLAFINASKSRSSSPVQSRSGASSPSPNFISEPYGDPIELMANKIAAEYMNSSDEFSSGSDDDILYSTPKATKKTRRVPSLSSPASPIRRESSTPSPTFSPGHRRKRSSLTSIPEED
ncbi:hypothetical protein D9613_003826 [Agrocybe pediades]|uniref:Uncharacterized protein n=1 Tax=Agrocybe pediades TaxID=84607 RepID=A0A8H4QIP3_9AGAR|nr:hypothetical protein D9613_003826 [Agrocybe pediades]KAF9553868.1 hypothetical protein CPC08DRAFT_754009 [Agrocybe pediades]